MKTEMTIRLDIQRTRTRVDYVIQRFDGHSSIGPMWGHLESGTKEEMEASFNSEKYADCKKINLL